MGGRRSLEKLVAYRCKVKERSNNGNKASENLMSNIHSLLPGSSKLNLL